MTSSPPVCYLERTACGTLLSRVRLLGDRLDASWTAALPPRGDDQSAAPDPGTILEQSRQAARWVADRLQGGPRRVQRICLDIDGGLCLWLSAPSADAAVVAAAMTQSAAAGGGSAGLESGGDSGGGLLSLAASGLGLERSVQALAASSNGHLRTGLEGAIRRRMAVLSVPDLPARVFLDELDSLGIECSTVSCLWHAMAQAWDPSSAGAASGGGIEARIAANLAPCTAVILLDPGSGGEAGGGGGAGGRLLWTWSCGGELLAAGSMRLRSVMPAESRAPSSQTVSGSENGPTGTSPPTARRIVAVDPGVLADRTLICGRAEAGRLVMDWLAWSAQLGQSPARIICVGPMPIAPDGDPGLLESLAESWQNATVDAAACPDPIGATLARLSESATGAGGAAAAEASPDDPRRSLVDLSRRPGRAHRRMHQWAAAALAAGAMAIGAVGWRMGTLAEQAYAEADRLADELGEAVAGLGDLAPNIANSVDPEGDLRAALNRVTSQRVTVDREMPVLAEVVRVLLAMEAEDDVRIEDISISSLAGMVRLSTGETAAGPRIVDRLLHLPGQMTWTGADSRATGAAQGMRVWELSGQWSRRDTRRPGLAGGRP